MNEGQPKFTRREFLPLLGFGALGVALGAAGLRRIIDQGTSSPESEAIEYLTCGKIHITFDRARDIPLGYSFHDHEDDFYPFNSQAMLDLKKKAISTGEPQVIKVIGYEEIPPRSFPCSTRRDRRESHPVLRKLPEDVLAKEDLSEKGLEIIQAKSTSLFIRSSAFDTGGILEDFQGTIVLVDGPTVDQVYMRDPRYDEVKGYVSDNQQKVEAFRESKLEELQANLKEKSMPSLKSQDGDRVLLDKYKIERLKQASPQELNFVPPDSPSGCFVTSSVTGNGNIVFLAVGGLRKYCYANLGFTSKGEFDYKFYISEPFYQATGLFPTPFDSYPNPEEIKVIAYKSNYAYATHRPGFLLRHEIKHGERGSEYLTDLRAMQTIQGAWDQWLQSDFQDDSGYPFVFSLGDDCFILTDNRPAQPENTLNI